MARPGYKGRYQIRRRADGFVVVDTELPVTGTLNKERALEEADSFNKGEKFQSPETQQLVAAHDDPRGVADGLRQR